MLSKSKLLVLLSVLTGLMLTACQSMDGGTGQEKVVYHVNDSDNATAALRNVGNHLDATEGKAKIVVVTHAKGIDFLLDGAQDKNGNPYSIPVEKLKERGGLSGLCDHPEKLARLIRSGSFPRPGSYPRAWPRSGKVQTREGYVYLKP